MNWFSNLKIGKKLIIGFLLVAILAGVVGGIGVVNIKQIASNDVRLYEKMTIPLQTLGEMQVLYQQIRIRAKDILLARDVAKIPPYIDAMNVLKKTMAEKSASLKTILQDDKKLLTYVEEADVNMANYYKIVDEITAISQAGKREEAYTYALGNGLDVATATQKNFDEFSALLSKQAKDTALNNMKVANQATILMVGCAVCAVIIAVFLGLFLSGVISKPINILVGIAKQLSVGDVNVHVKSKTKDEIGVLMSAFESMVANIKEQADAAEKIAKGNTTFKFAEKSSADIMGQNLNLIINSTNEQAGIAELIAGGDLSNRVKVRSEEDSISKNLNLVIDAVSQLVADANQLRIAAVEGRLSTRADINRHNGEYRKVIEGVNLTLDAVIAPVQEASNVLVEMSKGNLRVEVTGDYKGDHAVIKNALNDTVENLRGYVEEISSVLNEMAEGNMVVGITADYRGDFSEIKDSLNKIIDNLNNVLGDINSAADQVNAGARQVSDSSQNLSQGSTEQASSIEEITASLTQVSAQTRQNAVSANKANELAITSQKSAVGGNDQMKEMLDAMEQINESSSNINKIIRVIDDIAFQTNILALNAAVEAARAGQHGKGFAVVAEEVRNLAARSANAAKETTTMIEGSIKKVEMGTKIANDTATALGSIVEGVSEAAVLVGQIAAASNEQATAITQISTAIEQVSQVTQMNTATAEQSAAASEELSSQSMLLKDMIGKFNLKKMDSGSSSSYLRTEHVNRSPAKLKKPTKNISISLDDTEFGKY